jgi:hypothetical protein
MNVAAFVPRQSTAFDGKGHAMSDATQHDRADDGQPDQHHPPPDDAYPAGGARRRKAIVSWTGAVLIGALMLVPVGAVPKLTGDGFAKDLFTKVAPTEALADPLRLFTGVLELAIAALVLVPATRALGALLAAGTMLGAIGAHLFTPLGVFPTLTDAASGESAQTPIFIFAVLGFLASAALLHVEREQVFTLLTRVSRAVSPKGDASTPVSA